jgi:hypothetical protein
MKIWWVFSTECHAGILQSHIWCHALMQSMLREFAFTILMGIHACINHGMAATSLLTTLARAPVDFACLCPKERQLP